MSHKSPCRERAPKETVLSETTHASTVHKTAAAGVASINQLQDANQQLRGDPSVLLGRQNSCPPLKASAQKKRHSSCVCGFSLARRHPRPYGSDVCHGCARIVTIVAYSVHLSVSLLVCRSVGFVCMFAYLPNRGFSPPFHLLFSLSLLFHTEPSLIATYFIKSPVIDRPFVELLATVNCDTGPRQTPWRG